MIIGIYHKDCVDGTTAAAVLLRKFPEASVFALRHRYEPEDFAPVLVAAQNAEHIYTVDCGIGVSELFQFGCPITTIDHHAGAREEFENLAKEHPNYMFVFNNEKSGASLSWRYFFPDEKEPEIITLVEDVDLWKWKHGDRSRDINNYASLFLNQPQELLPLLDGIPDMVREKGAVISNFSNQLIGRYVEKIRPITLQIGEYAVPAYNITDFQSDCGGILSGRHNSAVALFTIRGASVNMSFRGTGHDMPTCLMLATTLGGGGHENSSGADVPLSDFLEMIVQNET